MMNRFDIDDDSLSSNEHASPVLVRPNLPSMYSPTPTDSKASSSKSKGSHASNNDAKHEELKKLFTYIDAYEPVELELETPLKCFMPPSYICSVGDVDPMIKIGRPDGVSDGVGTAVLDEALPSKQSNAAVVELQLRNQAKKGSIRRDGGITVVRSISKASENTNEIDQWVQSVEEIHSATTYDDKHTEVRYRNKMPSVEELMQPWPADVAEELKNGTLELPTADIDLNFEEYARMMCMLLGIPVHDGCVADSVHVLLSLFVEMQSSK